jgi:hypothetical protein
MKMRIAMATTVLLMSAAIAAAQTPRLRRRRLPARR